MIIQAELKCKQTGCEADPCAVDKVIELPSSRFQQFSRALLADYDFIAENKNAIRHDEDARHCLLILDADGTDGFLVDPQGYNYARYSAFVPNARSLLTLDMAIDRSYLSPVEPWRDESRDEMLRMTLRVNGKPDYILVLPADEQYLDAVKTYLDIDVFADAMLCDIRFKVPYIGELIRDTDCPAVEDYNDFAEALEDIWQKDGMLLTYAAVLEAERPDTLRGACELLRNLDNYQRITEDAYGYGQQRLQETLGLDDEAIYELDGYVACCGTSIQPVLQMLEQAPQLDTVLLCLDNDEAGHQASRRMREQLEARYSVERLIPENKDWNDDLTLSDENAQGFAMNELR